MCDEAGVRRRDVPETKIDHVTIPTVVGAVDFTSLASCTMTASRSAPCYRAVPWRLFAADYLQSPAGTPLRGPAAAPKWDQTLEEAMRQRGRAVHEEVVLPALLGDLATSIDG